MLLLGVAVGEAGAASMRVRWQPVADSRIAGYNVYVRLAGAPYGAPIDARLPALQPDRTMALVVSGITAGRTYYVALTFYTADRTESAMSQELVLGATDPCRIDSCSTPKSCQVTTMPDGTQCGEANFCSACRAGACSTMPTLQMEARKVRLRAGDRVSRLSAHGTLTLPHISRLTVTGLTLTIADPVSGLLLYEAVVPPSSLDGDGRMFLVAAKPVAAPGSLRMRLLILDGVLYLNVRAIAADLRPYLPLSRLAWVVRLGGDDCAQQSDLTCTSDSAVAICR